MDGDVVIDAKLHPGEGASPERGAEQGGLPQGLGGNGAGVDHRAPGMRGALHDGGAVPIIRGLGGGFFTGGPAAETNEVVGLHIERDRAKRAEA